MTELRDAFSNYAEGGEIFLRDIGPVVRCVKGLKPGEMEVREMMIEAEKSGRFRTSTFESELKRCHEEYKVSLVNTQL